MSPMLTVTEAAALLRVSPRSLQRWAKEGRIAAVRLPSGRLRFPRESIQQLLDGGIDLRSTA